jgi:hypothetical protein
MTDMKIKPDVELSAIQAVYAALEPLEEDAQKRVLNYIASRLKASFQNAATPQLDGTVLPGGNEEAAIRDEQKIASKFGTFAELYNAAAPKTNADKALVAGYWLQVCRAGETFDGGSANKELKNLGHGLANITNAIDSLKGQKPAFALQLKKSGKSQQARKVYKITVEGIKGVEKVING